MVIHDISRHCVSARMTKIGEPKYHLVLVTYTLKDKGLKVGINKTELLVFHFSQQNLGISGYF